MSASKNIFWTIFFFSVFLLFWKHKIPKWYTTPGKERQNDLFLLYLALTKSKDNEYTILGIYVSQLGKLTTAQMQLIEKAKWIFIFWIFFFATIFSFPIIIFIFLLYKKF